LECEKAQHTWVYVGRTSHSPAVRFQQHKEGYKASRWVRKYGTRLLPDLYADIQPVRSFDEVAALEEALAANLEADGYCVQGGH
jgi:hypothetical protein